MKVHEVPPPGDAAGLLPGTQFADAYCIEVPGPPLDAHEATQRMTEHPPRWTEILLSIRNLVVAPFGLKTSGKDEKSPREMMGIFPIISETPDRLVAGFNDKHLDFRVVVDVAAIGTGQQVTATTLVKTHNRFGRAYLTLILPFHRLIVASMLRRIA
ncbi:MAG TPA: DUF2867 domain-containing protein [Bradyrhizobium sp.]|nr:DUF2867 domain-containing protein [Bradyrhizobium sp.]